MFAFLRTGEQRIIKEFREFLAHFSWTGVVIGVAIAHTTAYPTGIATDHDAYAQYIQIIRIDLNNKWRRYFEYE